MRQSRRWRAWRRRWVQPRLVLTTDIDSENREINGTNRTVDVRQRIHRRNWKIYGTPILTRKLCINKCVAFCGKTKFWKENSYFSSRTPTNGHWNSTVELNWVVVLFPNESSKISPQTSPSHPCVNTASKFPVSDPSWQFWSENVALPRMLLGLCSSKNTIETSGPRCCFFNFKF